MFSTAKINQILDRINPEPSVVSSSILKSILKQNRPSNLTEQEAAELLVKLAHEPIKLPVKKVEFDLREDTERAGYKKN